jgi:hypothetical protein
MFPAVRSHPGVVTSELRIEFFFDWARRPSEHHPVFGLHFLIDTVAIFGARSSFWLVPRLVL